MPKIDMPELEVKKSSKTFVTVPEHDIFDKPFATLRLGPHVFEAGVTYELEEPLATTLKERIRVWEKANIRLLQPKKDDVSEAQVDFSKGHTGART